jgi:hypothetical protein
VARHHLLPLEDEERVAQREELEPIGGGDDLRRVRVEVGREPGGGLGDVERGERGEVRREAAARSAELLRQLA